MSIPAGRHRSTGHRVAGAGRLPGLVAAVPGRLAGLRSNDSDVTLGIREYSCTMDGTGSQLYTPLWDAEYARGESPRRVWDNYTPMLNPRWDGVNPNTKYITGGYFYIASDYHQALGLNSGNGDVRLDYQTSRRNAARCSAVASGASSGR